MVVLVVAQLKSGECCEKKKKKIDGNIGPLKSSFFMPLVKITKRVIFLLCFYLFRKSQLKFLMNKMIKVPSFILFLKFN
jgi:hypothetical protein